MPDQELQQFVTQLRELFLHEEIEYVRQGAELFDVMVPDFVEFKELLSLILEQKLPPHLFSQDVLDQIFKRSKHSRFLSLCMFGVLARFEEFAAKVQQFKLIDLSGMRLEMIPESLSNFPNLTELNICKNPLIELPTQITALKIDGQQLTQFTEDLIQRPLLTYLDLSKLSSFNWHHQTANQDAINGLLQRISGLNIQTLFLRENRIKELKGIENLTTLKVLNLYRNRLKTLPKGIEQLNTLEELNLQNNALTELGDQLYQLNNLRVLHLGSNELNLLSESICSLENLEELHLKYNVIKQFPSSMSNLKTLRKLDLSSCMLKEIPKFLVDLPKLEFLDLRRNNFRDKLAVRKEMKIAMPLTKVYL
jgi:Leucine-rich repeat (LRR) protein